VPIDRAAILPSAETLLQQGKLESAIAEYRRIVDEQPEDWTTANILGDLYIHAGQNDKAVEQFVRIADHLQRQGFLPKAAALYKKVLRIRPDDDHALSQAGEIAASQGLLVDANAYLKLASERRSARGDHRGAAEIRVRLGSLDVKDFEARRAAAYARIELGDVAGALSDLKAISNDLTEKGREKEAAQLLTDVLKIHPDDVEMRPLLFVTLISCSDIQSARELATTAEQLTPARGSEPSLPGDTAEEPLAIRLASLISPDAVKSQALPPLERRAQDEAGGEGGEDLDIDQVFAQFRDKASGGASEAAEQEYERGVALYEAGQVTDGIRALEAASRAPIHRFRAAAALGRIYRDRGALSQAIEWFERAAGAPAPRAEDGHALFHELAVSLESLGEVKRALAICLELQAEAGDYRDLSARISRLTKAQARG
jgi:tetratricopeptide (TPR) repeat protein